jgi:hypothetical protein
MRFPGQFYDRNASLDYNYFRDYDRKIADTISRDVM